MGYRENAAPSVLRDKLIESIDQAEAHIVALRVRVEHPQARADDVYAFTQEIEHRRAALRDALKHKESLLDKLREAGF